MDLDTQLKASLGDNYALERELAAGGMARVFVATEVALGRKVVIKVLPPETSSTVLAERFRREISLAAQLRHPHIIPLLTAGDAGGLLYYTMPFVEGETLRARLVREELLPIDDSIRIIREIAYALSYAHGQGVVHRDIKPENVLIENGHAVVADFGVAKALASAANPGGATASTITDAGTAMGTAMYMAPEQAAGDPATDHRADIYALGVVAYEILAGAPPFSGGPHQVIVSHMVDTPEPLSSRRPDAPAPLADLVMKLLEKKPDNRPQNATDVVTILDGISPSGGTRTATHPPRARRVPRSLAAAGVIIALAAAGYGGYTMVRAGKAETTAAAAAAGKSVAVLPFVNTSGGAENEHFSNGLTDELISALGQVQGLKVAARTSVFALQNRGLGARAIADTLGVATVIEGSARRDGKRLKVNAQLVGAADGAVLWSQAFDRQIVDVFAVQEEIARAIVGALNIHLTPVAQSRLAARPTADIEAYDLYLKGRFHLGKRSKQDIEMALEYFQNAIQRDPRFASAYAEMANAYVSMSNLHFMPIQEATARANVAADYAIALDSTLGEAHAAKGLVLAALQDFAGSERELRRAIELNPSYAPAYHFYSLLLTMLNRESDATEQNRLTLALDPLSPPANAHRGVMLLLSRKYAAARRELQRAIPLTTTVPYAQYYLGTVEANEGKYDAALRYLESAHRIAPGFVGLSAARAYTYARVGRRAESDSIRAELRQAHDGDRSRIQLALAEAVMGNLDSAFTILEKPTRWDIPTLIELRADPLLASFRADARYPQLLARIGLQP